MGSISPLQDTFIDCGIFLSYRIGYICLLSRELDNEKSPTTQGVLGAAWKCLHVTHFVPGVKTHILPNRTSIRCKNVPKPCYVIQPVPIRTRCRELYAPFGEFPSLRAHYEGACYAAIHAVLADMRVRPSVSRPRRASRLVSVWHRQFVFHFGQPPSSSRVLLLSQLASKQQ